jgi:hypothetical protein
MLNDDETPHSTEKVSFENPPMTSYPIPFDTFRLSLTVFELLAENRFDRSRDAP